MKKIFAILLSALALGGCENDGIPYVSLGLDDLYKVARMQTVDLKPAFTGESYRWTVKTASGADSLLSEEKDYIFLMQYPGTYDVTFQIFDPVNPIVHRMTFYVVEEEVEYSPYISTVYEYCPAPGQFVNAMPEYREGDTAETMRQKAEEAIAGKMQSGVSLGAYGGYITFGFDHTVVNVPGEYDIRIDGNSFNSAAHPGVDGGSSEPGIIMVMFDENQNGKPDDKWYEIDKNPWYTDEAATYGYEITYHRPAPDHVPTPGEGNDSALTDMTYIKWEDNRGQTDYVYKNKFHDQDYYPKWIDADEMTHAAAQERRGCLRQRLLLPAIHVQIRRLCRQLSQRGQGRKRQLLQRLRHRMGRGSRDPRTGAPAGGRLYPRLHRPKPVLRLDRRDLH